MGDWRLQLALTFILGRPGSGKSTFAFAQLYNMPAACRFIFDHQGRDGPRLAAMMPGVRVCFTAGELEASVPTRWSVFNPSRMFPDDLSCRKALAFWLTWVYNVSCRGPGKKLVLINEINDFQDRDEIPPELARIVLRGREEDIQLVCCAQEPHKVNSAITGAATEIVAFKVGESDQPGQLHRDPALSKVASMGLDAEAVRNLPLGSFIARNKLSGGMLSGKVF